jgi:hypothetical protein
MMDIEKIKQAVEAGKPRLVYEDDRFVIIETKPTFRTIKTFSEKVTRIPFACPCGDPFCQISYTYRRNVEYTTKTYRLAVPYVQYYANEYRRSVSWTDKPIETLEQVVGIPLLPNIFSRTSANPFNVCVELNFPHLGIAEDFCHSFWNSVFTPDECDWYYKKFIHETKLKSFQHWHELSKDASDPMEVFEGFDFAIDKMRALDFLDK